MKGILHLGIDRIWRGKKKRSLSRYVTHSASKLSLFKTKSIQAGEQVK